VREFIQRFGGRIAVESETGKGTTFHIFFPFSS
jgi:signal transduction histidine kinase